jgi:hypothetical protein
MQFLRKKCESSPEFARVAPLAIYAILGFFQDGFGPEAKYWAYIAKTLLGAWVLWQVRPFVQEMRWKAGLEALGVSIFTIWIGLGRRYLKLGARDSAQSSGLSR